MLGFFKRILGVNFVLASDERCPNCKSKLAKVPKRKKKCSECGGYIYSRTHPETSEHLLCSKFGAKQVDKYWKDINKNSPSKLSVACGKGTVQENFNGKIHSATYFDISDGKSCDFCTSMDLATFKIDDPIFIELKDIYGFGSGEKSCKYCTCPNQYRGRWSYTLNDQLEKPKITGLSSRSRKIMNQIDFKHRINE